MQADRNFVAVEIPDKSMLDDLFQYNSDSGELFWKGGYFQGERVGCLQKRGYIRTSVKGRSYYAHRIIWCMKTGVWPVNVIDHINGNRSDNRWSNLRELTAAQNSICRVHPGKNKKLNVLGVCLQPNKSLTHPFVSFFRENGKTKRLGSFKSIYLAKAAYEAEKARFLATMGINHDQEFHLAKAEGINVPFMASIQQRGERWQLRVKHQLLPAPFFHTFDTEDEAKAYGSQLEGLLSRGIVPLELAGAEKRGSNPTLARIITQYLAESNCALSDRATINLISTTKGDVRLLAVTPAWADLWVSGLKVDDHLAPGTIRKRVECLARVIDWYRRKMGEAAANPLRSMPRGYASPTADELAALKDAGREVRRDEQRNRRLDAGELERTRSALAGTPRPDRQRPLPADPAFALLFELILATGMRLSEAYSLRVDQIDFARWVINVAGSKGHRGQAKPRTVPLVRSLRVPLQNWCRDRVGLVFAFWDGTPLDKPRCTSRLSNRFGTLFDYAGVADCTEHDLRHCATCAWFELRDAAGRWVFSEIEICKIMGWSDTRMALRYASLRGEDLAARLG